VCSRTAHPPSRTRPCRRSCAASRPRCPRTPACARSPYLGWPARGAARALRAPCRPCGHERPRAVLLARARRGRVQDDHNDRTHSHRPARAHPRPAAARLRIPQTHPWAECQARTRRTRAPQGAGACRPAPPFCLINADASRPSASGAAPDAGAGAPNGLGAAGCDQVMTANARRARVLALSRNAPCRT
jgi:hypothetical protein